METKKLDILFCFVFFFLFCFFLFVFFCFFFFCFVLFCCCCCFVVVVCVCVCVCVWLLLFFLFLFFCCCCFFCFVLFCFVFTCAENCLRFCNTFLHFTENLRNLIDWFWTTILSILTLPVREMWFTDWWSAECKRVKVAKAYLLAYFSSGERSSTWVSCFRFKQKHTK